ncbi:MAG: aminotransferase class III-fold pyridoxal phosphate-dependent enzyme, partial [Gammaproteobacteria bacterium]
TIAAVIVEPMAGSAGVLPPPKGYLKRLREICDEHDILLIFDEVITGFGRLGSMTAAERFGVQPDIITFAKGVTSGVVPMGGVGVRDEIYETLITQSATPIELFHGYTYSGHPLASVAALATLDAYEQDGMFENAEAMSTPLADAVHALKGQPHVIDIRSIGLVAAIEMQARPGAPGARGFEVMKAAWEKGLMVRFTADILAISPPLIVDQGQIEQIFDTLAECLREVD